MPLRAALQGVLSLVTHALIEPRRLKTMCGENDLHTAARASLGFSGSNEFFSEPLPAVLLVYPDMRELAATSPSMTIEACNDLALLVSHCTGQESSVEVASLLRIELIYTLNQEG